MNTDLTLAKMLNAANKLKGAKRQRYRVHLSKTLWDALSSRSDSEPITCLGYDAVLNTQLRGWNGWWFEPIGDSGLSGYTEAEHDKALRKMWADCTRVHKEQTKK